MRFAIPISHPVPFCVFAAHGAVDAALPPSRLLPYALALLPSPPLPPLPPSASTAAFGVASLVHFASDVGVGASVALHLWWMLVWCTRGPRAGFARVLAYGCGIHLPLVVWRAARGRDVAALRALMCGVAIALTMRRCFMHGPCHVFVFGERLQRIVTCHVLVHLWE